MVPLEKITDYRLDETHPQGRSKAVFFRSLGFRREDPEALQHSLLQLAISSDMTATTTDFGRTFAGEGMLRAPGGRHVRVVTVWMLRAGNPPPLFVTAYPSRGEKP